MDAVFGLLTNFHTKPEDQEKLAEILLRAAEVLEDYQTCLQYQVILNANDREVVSVLEVWTDKGHHEASLENPATVEAINEARPLILSIERQKEFDFIGGKGI